ncbi:MAG TPA: hypothetical protein VNR36_09400 [Pseudolysinimonas sp.]|nr:hypothetical protein [Pseudolysinimonas sp.]
MIAAPDASARPTQISERLMPIRTWAKTSSANSGSEISRATTSTAPGSAAQIRATAVKLRP